MNEQNPTPWRIETRDEIGSGNELIQETWIIDANNNAIVFSTILTPSAAQEICDAMNLRGRYRSQREDAIQARVEMRRLCRSYRDLVEKLLPLAEMAVDDANKTGDAIKGLCALRGVDSSIVDKTRGDLASLIKEAHEAIQKQIM